MELDGTTFILEIGNFLILVWIMNRLLYAPVMNAIASRREGLARTAAEAGRLRDEAAELEARYRRRLTEWEQEKDGLRQKMLAELQQERSRLEQALRESLARERDKDQAIRERELRGRLRELESIALGQGGRFVAALLKELATPELEGRLQELFMARLSQVSREQLAAIEDALRDPAVTVSVASAFVCPEALRNELRQQLETLCNYQRSIEFREQPELIAGIRLKADAWILDATLRGEVRFFTEAADHGDPQA